jgi:hypothetical protein
MYLQEKMMDKVSGIRIRVFGPKPKQFGEVVPQLSFDATIASNLRSYQGFAEPIVPMHVVLDNPCHNADVKAFGLANGFIEESDSPAQFVAESPATRKALQDAGFDGYADYSALENSEPFQIVVFEAIQLVD